MRQPASGQQWGTNVVTIALNTQIAAHTANSQTLTVPGVKKGQTFIVSPDYPLMTQGVVYAAESINDGEIVFTVFNTGSGTFTFTQAVHFTINIEPVG